jgi:pimeloyl-ACP methyl ester carboxylesterase
MLGILKTTLAAASAAVLAATALAADANRLSPYPRIQFRPVEPRYCLFNRIMLGPSGTEVAVWGGERRHVLAARTPTEPGKIMVGRMGGSVLGAPDRFLSYDGIDPAVPVRWSATGATLFARAHRDRIVSIDADSGRVDELGPLDTAWAYVDLRAATHGGLDILARPDLLATARRVDQSEFYRGSATLGEDVTFLGVRRNDLAVVRIDEGGRVSEPVVRASFTRSLIAFPDDRDYPGGVAYVGAERKNEGRFLPYQLPLVDLGSGRVVGKFGPGGLELSKEGELARPLARYRTLADDGIILDASFSSGVVALLTSSERGDVRIRRISRDGVAEKHLCTNSRIARHSAPAPSAPAGGQGPRARVLTLDAAGREVQESGRPILVAHQAGATPADEAVLYFPGGPGGSLSDTYFPAALNRLLDPRRDVIAVGYAGSVGGGRRLVDRLTREGMSAIENDIVAIMRWLEPRSYKRVYIVAESFGGVPATIAVARYPDRIDAVFLIAPLLKLKEPDAWVKSGAFVQVAADGQRGFEEAVFGGAAGRARFAADLASLMAGAPYREGDRLFFAPFDMIAQPADLPHGNKAPTVTIRGAHHGTLAGREEVWSEVFGRMENIATSKK